MVGTLYGFDGAEGLCSDQAGNVWVTSTEGESITEYAHGGTSPIATLADPYEYPDACSVDPITGNLAVANVYSYSSGPGSVAIYTHAQGAPTLYYDRDLVLVFFCGYDDKSNLFVDGTSESASTFALAELAAGRSSFRNITLTGGTINVPGNIQWDGRHLAVGDQLAASQGSREVSAIYQTTGRSGKIVGETLLDESNDVNGFWIQGGTVIAPNEYSKSGHGSVGIYKYPAGGRPRKTLTHHFGNPYGATVSVAP